MTEYRPIWIKLGKLKDNIAFNPGLTKSLQLPIKIGMGVNMII